MKYNQKLSTKAWKNIDAVFADERMRSMFHKSLHCGRQQSISNQSVWADGDDIFRKKAEGFQSLAISQAYVAALSEFNNGNKSPVVSIPVVLDASSNIYQHASF